MNQFRFLDGWGILRVTELYEELCTWLLILISYWYCHLGFKSFVWLCKSKPVIAPVKWRTRNVYKLWWEEFSLFWSFVAIWKHHLGVWNIEAHWRKCQRKKAGKFLNPTDPCLNRVAALYFEVLWLFQTWDTSTLNVSVVEAWGYRAFLLEGTVISSGQPHVARSTLWVGTVEAESARTTLDTESIGTQPDALCIVLPMAL